MVAKTARWLAPIALLAVAAGVYLLVHNALLTHVHTTASSSTSTTFGTRRPTITAPAHLPKFYVVRSGDTLSEIAHTTHVSLAELETLNPSVSPNSLQTGQRLRLRR